MNCDKNIHFNTYKCENVYDFFLFYTCVNVLYTVSISIKSDNKL